MTKALKFSPIFPASWAIPISLISSWAFGSAVIGIYYFFQVAPTPVFNYEKPLYVILFDLLMYMGLLLYLPLPFAIGSFIVALFSSFFYIFTVGLALALAINFFSIKRRILGLLLGMTFGALLPMLFEIQALEPFGKLGSFFSAIFGLVIGTLSVERGN